jgi:hypothetical protein
MEIMNNGVDQVEFEALHVIRTSPEDQIKEADPLLLGFLGPLRILINSRRPFRSEILLTWASMFNSYRQLFVCSSASKFIWPKDEQSMQIQRPFQNFHSKKLIKTHTGGVAINFEI